MAKNIYLTPELINTTNKFDTFTLEFKGIHTPPSTFWSLCNFEMDLTKFKENYKDAEGSKGYGGFQTTIEDRRMVFYLSDIYYTENSKSKILKPERIYPKEIDDNYLASFHWKTNSYYKFVIKSWIDYETNKTFIGEWIQDMDIHKWYLISYFDTNLENSFITGSLSQYQENFYDKYFGVERSFNIRNIYAYDIDYKKWISLNTTTMSYDLASWGYNTAGTHDFGFTDNYSYGSSGELVDDQEKYDEINPEKIKASINQSEIFEKGKLNFYLDIEMNSTMVRPHWIIGENSVAPLRFKIIFGKDNWNEGVIFTKNITRPEQREYIYKGNFEIGVKYKFTLVVYGLFGETGVQTTVRENPSPGKITGK